MKSVQEPVYSVAQIKRFIYLKEIFFLSIAAFGGPGAHLNAIIQRFVKKRNYLSEAELLEMYSFCQLLPGPTSTQMIMALGMKLGGPLLGIVGLVIWILPAFILMLALVLGLSLAGARNIDTHFLRFIPAMAVGFIAAASVQMFRLMQANNTSRLLYFLGAAAAITIRSPWVFPIVLLVGGGISRLLNREEFPPHKPKIRPNWKLFGLFAGILILTSVVGNLFQNKPVLLFQNSYQFGSIVFGGGNVLIPMMFKQYVSHKHYLDAETFVLGVGMLQAMPGPVFSISTFANAMALSDMGMSGQVLGAILGTVGIFLPGILIMMIIFPIWTEMKQMPLYKKSIEGIASVSAGLVLAAAYLLLVNLEWDQGLIFIPIFSIMALVLFTKIPPPVLVFATLICGWLLPL
ncbi:MAG: chromate efflux transporter [Bacteroidetes bacterium]|nr:MAG: chromate efflux transporter [Bacteroidota bacterium]